MYNDASALALETELCDVESALREAEEQAAYWSERCARLYEQRDRLLKRAVAVPPRRVFRDAALP